MLPSDSLFFSLVPVARSSTELSREGFFMRERPISLGAATDNLAIVCA